MGAYLSIPLDCIHQKLLLQMSCPKPPAQVAIIQLRISKCTYYLFNTFGTPCLAHPQNSPSKESPVTLPTKSQLLALNAFHYSVLFVSFRSTLTPSPQSLTCGDHFLLFGCRFVRIGGICAPHYLVALRGIRLMNGNNSFFHSGQSLKRMHSRTFGTCKDAGME